MTILEFVSYLALILRTSLKTTFGELEPPVKILLMMMMMMKMMMMMMMMMIIIINNSHQVLNTGDMAWVYGDRIVKAVLGLSEVFSNLENTATLQ